MRRLSWFQFNVWTDGADDRCSIRWERPEGEPGLRCMWFVFSREEFARVARGDVTTVEDGYHKLSVWGDAWTFYNVEVPSASAGTMQVPFYRANIPRLFVKMLLRVATWTWAMQRKYQPDRSSDTKVELDFSAAHRERICRLYGQGKGRVDRIADPETNARLDALAQEDEGFKDRLDQITNIARNTTRGFHESASVRISKDSGGFFWSARTPRGFSTLHGGLINHARSGGHDWSLHT